MKVKHLSLIMAVLCSLFAVVNPARAQIGTVWQQRIPALANQSWRAVASSSDGTRLAAVMQFSFNSNYVYTSSDSGATWTNSLQFPFQSPLGCHAIVSSTNGTKLAVITGGSSIYTSSDSGATWANNATPSSFFAIASSANGTQLVAVPFSGNIYISTDSGTNWTARGTNQFWTDVASSADGVKLFAISSSPSAPSYISTNSGVNWTVTAVTGNSGTSSAGGTTMATVITTSAAISGLGIINISTNSGAGWVPSMTQLQIVNNAVPAGVAPALNWTSIAMSSDGTHLVAGSKGAGSSGGFSAGIIYASTNSGSTWQLSYAPDGYWISMASSADGNKWVAANANPDTFGGGIYTYAAPSTNAPALNITTGGGNASVSWPWPSSGYVMQQSSNLVSWVNLTNAPSVVNQTILPQTNGNNFYRLVKP